MTEFDAAFVDDFLAHHWRFNPVNATFMGARGFDHLLPPLGPAAAAEEAAANAAFRARVAATAEPDDLGGRLDRRMLLSWLAADQMALTHRPRFANPAWISGEAAFGVISLLLPQSGPRRREAVATRLEALPGFLAAGAEALAGQAVPRGWAARAQRESAAMAAFLAGDIRLHEAFGEDWSEPANRAAEAFERFGASLADLPDANPACGEAYLTFLTREVHGLKESPRELVAIAEDAFRRLGAEMAATAATIDPAKTAGEIVAGLSERRPADPDAAIASYRDWDGRSRRDGAPFVTPADEYDLDYRWMAPCFRQVSQALYFLFYRSPPGLDAGAGSVYWVTPPGEDGEAFLRANATATVKTIHSVHHGSIGHHTQNARARAASSRLARVAGTDCALGLAFLGSGTLIEGWACYVEDLLVEAPGFYDDPAEPLLLKAYERRNAASVLVDAKLHLGDWTMAEAMRFYRDEAGFAPARVENEVVRNSMMPGSRLMYWLGVEGIKALRARWTGETRGFHDALLAFGHVPLAWIAEEMQRAGQLRG